VATTLYVRQGCGFCAALREKLEARGVSAVVIDVGASPQSLPELMKLTGRRRIVPVLVEGTKISVAPDGGSEF
jgi:glutaredoxin